MLEEKHVDAAELMADLDRVIADVAAHRVAYLVRPDQHGTLPNGTMTAARDVLFVIVPVDFCERLFGDGDPEYGWPVLVDLDAVEDVSDLAPGRRRHPFLRHGSGEPIAASITIGEYEAAKDS